MAASASAASGSASLSSGQASMTGAAVGGLNSNAPARPPGDAAGIHSRSGSLAGKSVNHVEKAPPGSCLRWVAVAAGILLLSVAIIFALGAISATTGAFSYAPSITSLITSATATTAGTVALGAAIGGSFLLGGGLLAYGLSGKKPLPQVKRHAH